MNTEYEATFIDVDINKIRQKLQQLNAKLIHPERLMKRVIFDPQQKAEHCWMRVRDEGDKITLSIKQITGNKIEDQKEVELIIDNFDEGVKFLHAIGAEKKSYQETKRESWEYLNVKIEIDTWPGLEPYIEIEGESEGDVKKVVNDLELDFSEAIFSSADYIYNKKLGIPIDIINNQTSEITFKNPPKKT